MNGFCSGISGSIQSATVSCPKNLVLNVRGYRGIKVARPQSLVRELNMTKSPTRESPPQTYEKLSQRHRNVYDYDGEYEFPTAQHWTASGERSHNSRSTN